MAPVLAASRVHSGKQSVFPASFSLSRATAGSAPKVADSVINLTAVDPDGDRHAVKGLVGQTLLQTLIRNRLETTQRHQSQELGSCNGNCEVTVAPEWLPKLPARTPEETEALRRVSTTGAVKRDSRLGCQLRLTPEMDGMTVAMVEERPYEIL